MPDYVSLVVMPGFLLRTPSLPFGTVSRWRDAALARRPAGAPDVAAWLWSQEGRVALQRELRALFKAPAVQEALSVASADLARAAEDDPPHADSRAGARVASSLAKYLLRMSARATPFGLFASTAYGRFGAETQLRTRRLDSLRRVVRLDFGVLTEYCERLAAQPATRKVLTYRSNPTLYQVGGQWRYFGHQSQGAYRHYALNAVDRFAILDEVLQAFRHPASYGAISDAVVAHGLNVEDANAFVEELVDAQLLLQELQLPVVGGDALTHLCDALSALPSPSAPLDRLLACVSDLDVLNQSPPGVRSDGYQRIATRLRDGLGSVNARDCFHVELVDDVTTSQLHTRVATDIEVGVNVLRHLNASRTKDALSTLNKFAQAFAERYEDRAVPLLEALDDEIGVPFQSMAAVSRDVSPLLEGVDISLAERGAGNSPDALSRLLLRRVGMALQSGDQVVELHDEDCRTLSTNVELTPLPNSFAAIMVVSAVSDAAIDRGEYQLFLKHFYGPSGASWLGRFTMLHPSLRTDVQELLSDEAAHEPEAIFAEIVHLPQGRFGNFIARPRFRQYEIAFLGAGAASAEETLELDDLFLLVRNGRLQLRSQRLAREVKPRLSNAHHPGAGSYDLAVYRFLYELQFQDVNVMSLAVRELELLPFSPRIMYRHLVLALARWVVEPAEVRDILQADGRSALESFRTWREYRHLPRYVVLEKGDNRLLLDLDNPICADILVDSIRKQTTPTVLIEQFPPPESAPVHGPDGAHCAEFVVAMNRAHQTASTGAAVVASIPAPRNERLAVRPVATRIGFPPGSEWVYAKVYTGHATADRLLQGSLGTMLRDIQGLEPNVRWFFIRYADPEFHLRFRIQSGRADVHERIRSLLAEMYTRHRGTGELHRLVLDAYEPEVERYGGESAIRLAEQLFSADSEATLGAIEQDVLSDANMRWQFACLGIHRLFDDFDYPPLERARMLTELTTSYRHAFGRGVDLQRDLRARIAQKYRVLRPTLSAILGEAAAGVHVEAEKVLQARSAEIRRVAHAYRQLEQEKPLTRPLSVIVQSFIHMHVNRVLRSDHQRQERVLYDLLAQYYRGSVARTRVRS